MTIPNITSETVFLKHVKREARQRGWLAVVGYVGTIFAANWAIEKYGIVSVGFGLEAPAAVYFVGIAFILRDAVHEVFGARGAFAAIIAGTLLSWFISPTFAFASATAFLVSECADMAIYAPLRKRYRVIGMAVSNIVGAVIDSLIFLSLAFGSLALFPGQVVGKLWMTALALMIVAGWRLRGDLSFRFGASRNAA